ncbi:7178_t:CDS:1, partial [Ambispora gerdemannii]
MSQPQQAGQRQNLLQNQHNPQQNQPHSNIITGTDNILKNSFSTSNQNDNNTSVVLLDSYR